MHEKQFQQMESLDSYLAKKRQRTEAAQEQLQKVPWDNLLVTFLSLWTATVPGKEETEDGGRAGTAAKGTVGTTSWLGNISSVMYGNKAV
jgi:hypothetical protein